MNNESKEKMDDEKEKNLIKNLRDYLIEGKKKVYNGGFK